MTAWWHSRDPREQLLLGILGLLVAVIALWYLALSPLLSKQAASQSALAAAKNDMRLMQRAAPALSGGNKAAATAAFDRSVLISLARQRDVRLTRVQPEANGDISVWIDDIETQKLYGLLEDLLTGYRAEMNRATITTAPDGLLSAQFTLSSP